MNGLCQSTQQSIQAARLDHHLSLIHDEVRIGRHRTGVLGLVAGAGLGVVAIATASSNNPSLRASGPWVYGTLGGFFIAGSLFNLWNPTEYELLARRQRQLSQDKNHPIELRIAMGEFTLQTLADKARQERRMRGALWLLFGSGQLIWYAAEPTRDRSWVLVNSAVYTVLGLLPLLSESTAETQQKAYRDWTVQVPPMSYLWQVLPLPSGVQVVARVFF